MAHALDGATLRVDRARRHFEELEETLLQFRKKNIDKVSIKYDPGPPQSLRVSFDKSLVVPLGFSLPLSDCIHNLRAALDYLVYELAFLDDKVIHEGTQFPIVDDPKDFQKKKGKSLSGLSDPHIRESELRQPYEGIEWTKTLRSISNPDKHRHLIVMKPQRPPSFFAHLSGNIYDAPFNIEGQRMYVKKEDVFSIGFNDGELSIIETLLLLIGRVGETIDFFKPDFK